MAQHGSFEELLDEALRHPAQGWDFSWIRERGRLVERPLPWEYATLVRRRANTSPDLLDIGTGGGELLASLRPLPTFVVATESYAPNVGIASRRLASLGVQVIHALGAPDNNRQEGLLSLPSLPFRDESFHLIIDRNEAFAAREIARVLASGGTFITEQSGGAEFPELLRLFDLPDPGPAPPWNMAMARDQVEAAGLTITNCEEARFEMEFRDVGALVWYLRMVPWAAPGFSPQRHRSHLEDLHRWTLRNGPIRVPRYAFWLEARR